MRIEILLLSATAFEQEQLAAQLAAGVEQHVAGRRWRQGQVAGRQVLLVEGGIGAVNTAHALTCALQALQPGLVLQAGVGGAYPGAGLGIGDVALASAENYGDLGVRTPDGWQPAEVIGIPVLQQERPFFNHFPVDPDLLARAEAALRGGLKGVGLCHGPFVTVQECSGLASLGAERAARFSGVCENMEGAAAAHLCRLYQIPFIEVRGISNLVEDRRRESWNLPLACRRAQEAALRLIEELPL
ncbi:MAG: futalosine hydrolase [Candidatus Handelsmanbacteria bacterium]|nr:futalosine hydrolase [Candidatus Handelsmanbacteria bacterium]